MLVASKIGTILSLTHKQINVQSLTHRISTLKAPNATSTLLYCKGLTKQLASDLPSMSPVM